MGKGKVSLRVRDPPQRGCVLLLYLRTRSRRRKLRAYGNTWSVLL